MKRKSTKIHETKTNVTFWIVICSSFISLKLFPLWSRPTPANQDKFLNGRLETTQEKMYKERKNDANYFNISFTNLLYVTIETPIMTTSTAVAAVIMPMVGRSSRLSWSWSSDWRKHNKVLTLQRCNIESSVVNKNWDGCLNVVEYEWSNDLLR